jgi:hypothetical protein
MYQRKQIVAVASALVLLTAVLSMAQPVPARAIVRNAGGAAGGTVTLPYTVPDNRGNQWMIYQYGQIQQQGNTPIYSQGAMLQINNSYPQVRNNQGRIDEKTGELLLENMPIGNVSLTRRILINKEEGYVRYIDIIKNTQNQEQTVNLNLNTNINYGVQTATTVPDPKKKDQNIAWVAQTHANGQCIAEIYAGKGAKVAPTIQHQQGNNQVYARLSPTIPAGKEVAIMHFHMITPSIDAGTKFVLDMKESKVMAGIAPAIRKIILNFRGGENFIGDYEILRGDILDVVELRSGDQLKGTLQEKSYKLQTFYGQVELPVDKVIGLINVGNYRPQQLLVTKDGEIFGGKLNRDTLALALSSGQVTQVPVSQITRMGYRKRSGEPEEWTFDKPIVLMGSGDRIGVQMPTKDVEVTTRYGLLRLRPDSIAAINFLVEEHAAHDVYLTDGSRFAGFVTGDAFEMKLSGEGPVQTVKFPTAIVRRLQFAKPSESDADDLPVLKLTNEDVLVGSLSGGLKLDTAFNTIAIDAGEIKRLVHTPASPSDVQVVLWDESIVSGQLQEQQLTCQLKSGVTLKVPVALVAEYTQPKPHASGAVAEAIKALVAELNADDFKKRNAAQERLIAMGPIVLATLEQVRGQQTPEAQQRIDAVLKQLGADGATSGGGDGAGATRPAVAPLIIDH